jgi:lipopolysaccharide transport system ATP-binding protein
MSDTIIKLENISKQYRLGQVGTQTIRGDFQRWWHRVRGKEDPTLKIGSANTLDTVEGEYVWALRDINLEVQKGEILGIIGKNGAGKSTLLKLLSRVTAPTTGKIKVKGRIASLLEVGTGFHPDLTGRENIFLNGAIMGMNKAEVKSKFDEIVDFAGVAKYVDTPVKRYSSGMFVRLAFAVAAHLEPDILVVDEVLAVGDAEFQKKAIGKMQDISSGGGRTVLFVSHNMNIIQKLCGRSILLLNGMIINDGLTDNIINEYINNNQSGMSSYEFDIPQKDENIIGYVISIRIEDNDGKLINEIPLGSQWRVKIRFQMNLFVKHFIIAVGIKNSLDVPIRTTWSNPEDLDEGIYEATFNEMNIHFSSGVYQLIIGLSTYERTFDYIENKVYITISNIGELNKKSNIVRTYGQSAGIFLNPMEFDIIKI